MDRGRMEDKRRTDGGQMVTNGGQMEDRWGKWKTDRGLAEDGWGTNEEQNKLGTNGEPMEDRTRANRGQIEDKLRTN